MNQRWREGRDSYRPAGEVIDPRDFEVAEIAEDAPAKAFVLKHHYSASYPAARWRFGLYRGGKLAGVAVFSHPASDAVLTNVFQGEATESVELGRFVLLDDVAGNGETWFLGRCFEVLRREGLRGVVSFSDPVARQRADGITVFPGHIGTIYQAHNGVFLGRGSPSTLKLLPDGTVFSNRAWGKIRMQQRGWRYSAAILERFGAERLDPEREDPRAWLRRWLPSLTRNLRHPGNYRYAWGLQRASRRALPTSLPYPKKSIPSPSPLPLAA